MNIQSLIGIKLNQTQGFLEDGTRVPLSLIALSGNVVMQIKTDEHDGYNAVQIGFGNKRVASKSEEGHSKKAGLTKTPRFLKEVRVDSQADIDVATDIKAEEIFEPGDIVDVVGTSKGKGFAGGVKRYHFKGGPKTHGQSDRHRAPGAIGQGTTPGRVYKGKRMAGKMGNEQVTIKNLVVLGLNDGVLYVRGLIPGIKGGLIKVTKVGKNKKFVPLYKKELVPNVDEVAKDEIVEELKKAEDAAVAQKEEATEALVEEIEAKNEEKTEEKKEEASSEESQVKNEEVKE